MPHCKISASSTFRPFSGKLNENPNMWLIARTGYEKLPKAGHKQTKLKFKLQETFHSEVGIIFIITDILWISTEG